MITIQYNKKTIQEDERERTTTYLTINGVADEDSFYLAGDPPSAHFYNSEIINILTSHTFEEISKSFSKFTFPREVNWWDDSLDIKVYCNHYFKQEIPCTTIELRLNDWEHWAKPWSMSSLAKEFETNIARLGNERISYWQEDDETVLNGFGIEYKVPSSTALIRQEIDTLLPILKTIIDETNKRLLESLDSEVVLTYFQFPEEIKTACKQYLVYFTQFIADMGIKVDTELKEELNHTLFKIIPANKEESLERIKEALTIYLNAPNAHNFQAQISNQTDIAAKQWEANFYHLKSQLSLATSIIQAKDSTIEMLQLSNYQYKQLLESHSLKKESEEEEDVIPGIVSLNSYEGQGFKINLAEIFRRLKRGF
ncbi:hypothetical protein ACFSKU_19830 [Pontibacter silvestris]|uniref:Uncharacterized protein n=1 Tax=Pontibacter silvestris TaxID=2305183 RepID=A0ABW4X2D9_9BACT|nr:hypothetical protein [Pontibacter silvestris]MCC9134863.1 hypothetical protein [Pontibacter silvestris]